MKTRDDLVYELAKIVHETCEGGDIRHDIGLILIGPVMKYIEERLDFYTLRMDVLQKYQKGLPEPYRTRVCNILANGRAYPHSSLEEAEEADRVFSDFSSMRRKLGELSALQKLLKQEA